MTKWVASTITISGGINNGAFYKCGYNDSSSGNSLIINMTNWDATTITISGTSGAFESCGTNNTAFSIFNCENWSETATVTVNSNSFTFAQFTHFKFPNVAWTVTSGTASIGGATTDKFYYYSTSDNRNTFGTDTKTYSLVDPSTNIPA